MRVISSTPIIDSLDIDLIMSKYGIIGEISTSYNITYL